MRKIRIALALATLLAASAAAPAMADTPYCDCILNCTKLYAPGSQPWNICVGVCEYNYGPGICSE